MNKIKVSLNNRLCAINQRSYHENLSKATLLFAMICIVGFIYFLITLLLFHTLWYHKLFALVSSAIFAYSLQDMYFEYLEHKVKSALPKATKKLSHYYTHYNGSIVPAIKETEEKGPEEARLYLVKIRRALMSERSMEEIDSLKKSFPFVWFRMLSSIILMAKEKGSGVERNVYGRSGEASNLISKSLMKISNILSFINVQQGYNDAELKYIQLFLYFSPFLFIFASDWINARILIEMNMQDVYQGIKAQNLKAYIFLSANMSAFFIHWMRKQQI